MQLTHQKESDALRKQVLMINSEMSELINNVEWLHSKVQTESDPAKKLKLAGQ
jgi:phosphoglycerate-specific signal transduction histidine kinase